VTSVDAQGCVAFLPLTLRSEKPKPDQYPSEIVTLGDHIRAVRIDRNLLQKDVALLLGVSTESVIHWELGQHEPHFPVLPCVMDFLGYCPYEPAPQWGARLLAIRQKRFGWSQEKMAREIGIDPSTLSRIEQNRTHLSRPVRRKIERYLGLKGKLLTGDTVVVLEQRSSSTLCAFGIS